MADLPIACTLSPDALKARRENLLRALLRRSTERAELPDGVRLRFAADIQILTQIVRPRCAYEGYSVDIKTILI
jgi:hypothetical protein